MNTVMVGQEAGETTLLVKMIPIDCIVCKLTVRRLSVNGLERIKASMQRRGFLENFPLTVLRLGESTYQLIDGNHRYEAAQAVGITLVPCVVKAKLSEALLYQMAMQSNNAAETVVPSTLVTYAEFIWARLDEQDESGKKRYTQSDVGKMLGWDRASVRDYAALKKICPEAWQMIGATFEKNAPSLEDGIAPLNGAIAPFTEGLLRSVLDLMPSQQLDLVQELATNKDFSKGKFKMQAERYQTRNEIQAYALQQLGDLGESYTAQLIEEVYSGAYDADWKTADHPKLCKLIAALRDEWERKNSMHLIHGDFYEEVQKIGSGSIDLILTDPPYNIARENEFELEGRQNISQDFGQWDKHEEEDFTASFDIWSTEWTRILRPAGSGYVFTSDRFISHLRVSLVHAGLHVKATIVWHKTNPGTQIVKTNFRSSVEYILFFTKGEGGHTFNWQGENEMHNFLEAPICAGTERLVDARGRTLHPTQKPERVIRHLMEISSNRGDTVFDGFAGVFTTARVAKGLGRKFIGIEQDKTFFDAAVRRLE